MTRELQVAQVFVELVDALLNDSEIVAALQLVTERSVELLAADAAGIVLLEELDPSRSVAVSIEEAERVLHPPDERGPQLDCLDIGEPVVCEDLRAQGERWPEFSEAALQAGFGSVHALPMRAGDRTVGVLALFRIATGALGECDAALGAAVADLAGIGVEAGRSARERRVLAEQLQFALTSRVKIEQAKGMLAERRGLSPDEAFVIMRGFARRNNRHLSEVALAVLHNDQDVAELSRS